jgi:hypothetical protein
MRPTKLASEHGIQEVIREPMWSLRMCNGQVWSITAGELGNAGRNISVENSGVPTNDHSSGLTLAMTGKQTPPQSGILRIVVRVDQQVSRRRHVGVHIDL